MIGKSENTEFACDEEYSKFCNKVLFLYNYIADKSGKVPTLREIDIFLIKLANDRLNKENGIKKD